MSFRVRQTYISRGGARSDNHATILKKDSLVEDVEESDTFASPVGRDLEDNLLDTLGMPKTDSKHSVKKSESKKSESKKSDVKKAESKKTDTKKAEVKKTETKTKPLENPKENPKENVVENVLDKLGHLNAPLKKKKKPEVPKIMMDG